MNNSFWDLFHEFYFWAAFMGWMIAQSIKILIALIKTKKFDCRYYMSTGGMPSAHSAAVTALATAVGLGAGWDQPVTIVAILFAMITMFDASTVRKAAGEQAKIINEMVEQLFSKHKISEGKLKELLGHTRLEVFMGMILGIIVAILVYSISLDIQNKPQDENSYIDKAKSMIHSLKENEISS
jgi:acid phosphatase family membrane protein YuiD